MTFVVDRASLVGGWSGGKRGDAAGFDEEVFTGDFPDQKRLDLGDGAVQADSGEPDGSSRSCRVGTQIAAPAATTAQSPARRSTFSYALPERGRIGIRTSQSSSSCATAVSYGPWWKSRMDTMRSPPGPRMTAFAPSTSQTVERSSAGSPWHRDPPIVPRLRTTGSAITRSASRRSGTGCRAGRTPIRRYAVSWRRCAPGRPRG